MDGRTKQVCFAEIGKISADLTLKKRESLPTKDFAVPESKAKKIGVASEIQGDSKGKYPIPDRAHARNALARVSQFGTPAEKKMVRAKVHAKYPDIGEGEEKGAACKTPGLKLKSKGKGRGLGRGKGHGPIGRMGS